MANQFKFLKNKLYQFKNCYILKDHKIIKEDVWVRNGVIQNPEKIFFDEKVPSDVEIDCSGFFLFPGLIDLQINGAVGQDFSMDPEHILDKISIVSKELLSHGVTSFCPTIVTSTPNAYKQIVSKVRKKNGCKNGAGVLGLHLEGPFICKEMKGAHQVEHITTFQNGVQALMETYGCLDNVAIVTLAPELPGAMEVIEYLSEKGVVVSLGHSSACLSVGEEAVERGATLITHLFNAMLPFHHRDPHLVGLLTSQKFSNKNDEDDNLNDDSGMEDGGDDSSGSGGGGGVGENVKKMVEEKRKKIGMKKKRRKRVYYGMISDGVHTHPAALNIANRAHPRGLILVTDAVSAMGLSDGVHHLGDQVIEVKGRRAVLQGTETLCGSITSLDECMRFFHKNAAADLAQAIEACTLHPAEVMKITNKKGTLSYGSDADIIIMDQSSLTVRATFIAGDLVWGGDELKYRFRNRN
ncbi:hypothetical protein HELRODRAFT_116040 [Helobdella robusta]|uniref:N-acetylglucosamine-6-phosphate deacetylase n=1 Tax=Helobdella robusta TaxID=6412 RepID=T1EGC6_HELRO|nr:hypothetical protein HELRODRAFT_116040 [Helobdella robusta]ESN92182.1 hypothetical protein HELRODRAFT_116040 [Helobdella robusta]